MTQQLIQIQKPQYEEYAQMLEHTKFKQIRPQYSDGENGRCALGVIISEMTGWNGTVEEQYNVKFASTGLPVEVCRHIVIMNDSMGKSYQEIADWLRTQ